MFTILMMIFANYIAVTATLLCVLCRGIALAEQRRPKP